MPGLLPREACEVVVEFAISRVGEKLAIRERFLPFVELAWRKKVSLRVVRETFVAVAGAGF
jgi:hypothetical protein